MNIQNKKNLIIIHNSPWQVLTSLECLSINKELSANAYFLIMIKDGSKSERQVKTIELSEGLTFKYIFYTESKISKLTKYLKLFSLFYGKKFNSVFVSQLDIPWIVFILKIIRFNQLCFYDEGVHSLEIENIKANHYNEPKKIIFKRLFGQYFIDKVYTSYEITKPEIDIIKISYELLKRKVKDFGITSDTYFIGQHIYGIYISIDDYLRCLEQLRNEVSKKIYYYPHRHEDENTIQRIKEIGLEVLENDYNIEYFFLTKNIKPHKIVGFVSSAMINIKKIWGKEVEVNYIRLPDSVLTKRRSIFIHRIYKEFESSGIKRIHI